ncbi:helix-turn-helix domain-containing protein [uncultured Jannaschia sp.]|uniref:winged helix-turn-helix transcriptional regulator n=1 Tax=uncultured Jannaschia sp. TaxID=293347 RepID=UPI002618EE4B|nr:helix-turn-helix domain-containing protein [uncultured Jannaschia sp.]
MELLGERWSLLIVRELMFGPRRFSDIRTHLPGISARVLTERLAGLEASGIVRRTTVTDPVPAQLYGLSEWGQAAEPIIIALGRWAAASPLHDPTLPLSPASFLLSLKTMLDVEAARDMRLTAAFWIGTARFVARLAEGSLPVERGEPAGSDLTFAASTAPALAGVFYGGFPPEEAGVTIDGDPERARAFMALFNLPGRVDPGATRDR